MNIEEVLELVLAALGALALLAGVVYLAVAVWSLWPLLA